MDINPAGGPRNGAPGNMTMRPPPSPGNGIMNANMRPPFPNQRPPPQQHQQQPGGNPAGRAPMTSPFPRQDPAPGVQSSGPMNPNIRPLPHQAPSNPSGPIRPPGGAPGAVPPQRPVQQQQQQPHQQQQQPRPQPPTPTGQHPQFAGQGRLPGATLNNGSQTQLRVGQNSPQSQPSLAMRPPHMQPGQMQPHVNGASIRLSGSYPNLTGPGMPPGNRLTPPSPSLGVTRSPQIRPLQQTQQTQGNGPLPPNHQQQQQHPGQHHQPSLRPSASHPHLPQQAGIRPPVIQGSPVLAHQTAVRPPTPLMQHQPRPRPTQAVPHGQPPSPFSQNQQVAPGHTAQLDMPSMNGGQPANGAPSPQQRPHLQPSQDMHQQQQRSPGARPIFDQMRQQTQPPYPAQGAGSPQNPQNANPAQRPPQRPTGPSQPQPSRQLQGPGSVPQSPQRPPTKEALTSSPPAHGHDGQSIDGRPTLGEQHNNQRPAHPQGLTGARPHPQQGPPGPAGFSGPHHAPRPLQAPGSPMQRPLGSAEIKLSGPPPNTAPRQAPALQQPQLHHQQQEHKIHELQQPVTLVEPDTPLSDSEGVYDGEEEDDIEGGSSRQTPPKSPAAQDTAPPSQTNPAAGGPPQGPPQGPPRGPPKGESHGLRKLSGAAGTGPVHIMQPSNNPTSPPASAFPTLGQPKPRVRPPPGNANHAPYRPPERPSQAPVMYSQSGQPAFTSPFPAQGDKDSSPAKSMVSQGAEATSSSVRPREGGLQKRVVASDSNATKTDGPASQQAPPSPKLHGLKGGPAILSLANHKTWAIRGGLVYLSYTAVFSCPPETTGVKGLYCKTTNGVGGIIKPFVAPHYNAHVGPHVDKYIAPVARQGHRIYIKVADPVVQGVFSAAGTVYKSTAKKHVDSAKEQVISILPYPFKPKSKATDKEAGETTTGSAQDQPHFEKTSRQPIHVQEPDHASDSVDETVSHDEGIVEPMKETFTEKVEDVVEQVQEAIVEEAAPITEALVEDVTESPEEPAAVKEVEAESTTETEEIQQEEAIVADDDINSFEADVDVPVKNDALEGSIFEKMAALKDSMKDLRGDFKEPEQEVKNEEASQPGEVPPTEPGVQSDAAATPVEEASTPVVEEEVPTTESVEATAESTIEFADKPTAPSEESELTPAETAEATVESPAVPVPEETFLVPESVENLAAEEEVREALPVETESVTDPVPHTSDTESVQSQEHVDERPEAEKEVEGESVVAEGGEERGEQKVEEEEEVKKEEATFEQQAAPDSASASEVEGDEVGHKSHDEL
ncbi:hypothetical protein EC957_007609 [Mortierella hygrophila]|uniref:Uncharacterized protein n=1 Tax=Mortierella hygrophila TaxID=979708 RepID=A0A9P6K5Y9_9FUNG|nr:hypothetical protein EC957_007609 [Mortierella hygrophila]